MKKEFDWRDVDPVMWKGMCPDCGEKARLYRKLVDHFWVSYNLCDCGRMFNFYREHENPLIQAELDMERVREIAKFHF